MPLGLLPPCFGKQGFGSTVPALEGGEGEQETEEKGRELEDCFLDICRKSRVRGHWRAPNPSSAAEQRRRQARPCCTREWRSVPRKIWKLRRR